MAYILSNPWTDAAEYGRALGDRIAEALINLPAVRARMALTQASMRQEQQNKEREFQLKEQEIKALQDNRVNNLKFRQEQQQDKESVEQSRLKNQKDATTQRMMAARQTADVRGKQNAQNYTFKLRQQAETQRHNKAMESKQSSSGGKQAMQQQIIQGAQQIFQKTKNPGLARKYIKDNAMANGVNIDPFAVSFGDATQPAPTQ
jgi:hypothetical protein